MPNISIELMNNIKNNNIDIGETLEITGAINYGELDPDLFKVAWEEALRRNALIKKIKLVQADAKSCELFDKILSHYTYSQYKYWLLDKLSRESILSLLPGMQEHSLNLKVMHLKELDEDSCRTLLRPLTNKRDERNPFPRICKLTLCLDNLSAASIRCFDDLLRSTDAKVSALRLINLVPEAIKVLVPTLKHPACVIKQLYLSQLDAASVRELFVALKERECPIQYLWLGELNDEALSAIYEAFEQGSINHNIDLNICADKLSDEWNEKFSDLADSTNIYVIDTHEQYPEIPAEEEISGQKRKAEYSHVISPTTKYIKSGNQPVTGVQAPRFYMYPTPPAPGFFTSPYSGQAPMPSTVASTGMRYDSIPPTKQEGSTETPKPQF
jgi:hypothetical protein